MAKKKLFTTSESPSRILSFSSFIIVSHRPYPTSYPVLIGIESRLWGLLGFVKVLIKLSEKTAKGERERERESKQQKER